MGIAIGCGINPEYGKIDPYWMAAGVIDEALRQVVSVGAGIERCAILDNFCWGNTNKPDRLGGLVRASYGCYDTALAYGVPFISGKDSLNNEYSTKSGTISIPPTLLISAIAVMDDVTKAVTMDAKRKGNSIYIVGLTHNELGGSQYFKMRSFTGNDVPRVDPIYGRRLMKALSGAISKGCVASCHDCSEGGMAVALAEMAFAGGLGMDIKFSARLMPPGQDILQNEIMLFSESNTRFIVEVDDEKTFLKSMKSIPVWKLGTVTGKYNLSICDISGKKIVDASIKDLESAWRSPFKEM
jgi:phosphoribosylformylglycinamidine synthase